MTDKAFKEKNPNFLREVKEQETKGSITHIAGAGGVGGGRDLFVVCNLQASLHEGVKGQNSQSSGRKAGKGCDGSGTKSKVTVTWTVRRWCWLRNTGQWTEGRTETQPRSQRRLVMERHHRSTEKEEGFSQ